MKIDGKPYRTIWHDDASGVVSIIDQTLLPHRFEIRSLTDLDDVAEAIVTMRVRGAPLIGATAAYGMALALARNSSAGGEQSAADQLMATRPTAVNLRWALDRVRRVIADVQEKDRADRALREAQQICDEDAATCEAIGETGLAILEAAQRAKTKANDSTPLQILTHCNAGWLATVDWGTALAPIYKAQEAGIPVHVWVDETRPRNQGASLTAWELGRAGVPHTVIVDNAGGLLMQRGRVDLCIVGSDRTAANGDVCNKIGTYLKALAARDNGVPFYVALPVSTIDWEMANGVRDMPIEERDAHEVLSISGRTATGQIDSVQLAPDGSPASNFAFDVTPAHLVTALLTEHGSCPPEPQALQQLRHSLN